MSRPPMCRNCEGFSGDPERGLVCSFTGAELAQDSSATVCGMKSFSRRRPSREHLSAVRREANAARKVHAGGRPKSAGETATRSMRITESAYEFVGELAYRRRITVVQAVQLLVDFYRDRGGI